MFYLYRLLHFETVVTTVDQVLEVESDKRQKYIIILIRGTPFLLRILIMRFRHNTRTYKEEKHIF